MKFTYKTDGTVTGFNRGSVPPELSGECSPQELIWGMVIEYYTAPSGTLIPLSQEDKEALEYSKDVDNALSITLENIDKRKREENEKDFPYNGHVFISDKDSIQSTQNQCLTEVGTDPIPTFRGTENEGCWYTPTEYVPFTCDEFIAMATAFFLRSSDNYTNASMHKMAVTNIASSGSPQDILDYDYSTGWH